MKRQKKTVYISKIISNNCCSNYKLNEKPNNQNELVVKNYTTFFFFEIHKTELILFVNARHIWLQSSIEWLTLHQMCRLIFWKHFHRSFYWDIKSPCDPLRIYFCNVFIIEFYVFSFRLAFVLKTDGHFELT